MGKFSRQILVQMFNIGQSLHHKISTGQQRALNAPSLFWDFIRYKLVNGYRHLGTTYQSCIQGSSSLSPVFKGQAVQRVHSSWTGCPLNMRHISYPKMSITNCQNMLLNIPEVTRLQLYCGRSLLYCMKYNLIIMCTTS